MTNRRIRLQRYINDLRAHIVETHAREGLSLYVQMQLEALRLRLQQLRAMGA